MAQEVIAGAQRLEGVPINFLSSPDDYIRKYSLGTGESAQRGDPRLLDYLPPILMGTLRGDFANLSPENQDRIGDKIDSSLYTRDNERLWRALLITHGGKMTVGKYEFIIYMDDKGDLVTAAKGTSEEAAYYKANAGTHSRKKIEQPSIPGFSDYMNIPTSLLDHEKAVAAMLAAADVPGLKEPKAFIELFHKLALDADTIAGWMRNDPKKYFNLVRLLVVAYEDSLPGKIDETRSDWFLSQGWGGMDGIGNLSLVYKVSPNDIITYSRPKSVAQVYDTERTVGKLRHTVQMYGASPASDFNEIPLDQILIREEEGIYDQEPLHEML